MRGKGLAYDYSLRLYRDLFRLDHLHFGLWQPGDPLDLEHLRLAQERFVTRLLGALPPTARTVLDVGCGMGANAERLLARGLQVDCLSPCAYQQSQVRERLGLAVGFHLTTFEALRTDRRYDVVLMSESSQYISRGRLFAKARELLTAGGSLLIADYFRLGPTRTYRAAHLLDGFRAEMRAGGFAVVREDDITAATAPTMDLARQIYERYALPVANVAREWITREHPRLAWIGRRLLRSRIEKLSQRVFQKPLVKFDARRFQAEARYLLLLLSPESRAAGTLAPRP